MNQQVARDHAEHESLSQAITHILEECRMVLPGIEALFGFQLVAVFSQPFWNGCPPWSTIFTWERWDFSPSASRWS